MSTIAAYVIMDIRVSVTVVFTHFMTKRRKLTDGPAINVGRLFMSL